LVKVDTRTSQSAGRPVSRGRTPGSSAEPTPRRRLACPLVMPLLRCQAGAAAHLPNALVRRAGPRIGAERGLEFRDIKRGCVALVPSPRAAPLETRSPRS
jgi:hypothetical protein